MIREMYKPNTEGWRKLANRKFEQAPFLETDTQKFDFWVSVAASTIVQPNFTETGWGLTKAPAELVQTLRDAIHTAYNQGNYRIEGVGIVDGEKQPYMIDRPDLLQRVLHELQPMHEAWAGIPLVPQQAYGFRLYRNDTSLFMHVDRSDTHIISCVLHIDSSDDAEPWPIVIEDYLGNTNVVVLTPGDMLFYESSKCFHGRPHKFVGSWYTSVFVHYYPDTDEWKNSDRNKECQIAVPLHWAESPKHEPTQPHMDVRGTLFREPSCPDDWCNLKDAVHWQGPAEADYVLTAGPKKFPLWGERDEL
jgi:hypothetical protein